MVKRDTNVGLCVVLYAVSVVLFGCWNPPADWAPVEDSGTDVDAGLQVILIPDAGAELHPDAGADAGVEPGVDAGLDAGTEPEPYDGGFTANVEVMQAKLPIPVHEPSAAWDGQHIWVFGGASAQGIYSNKIHRYDEATDSLVTTQSVLPTGRQASSAVWTGTAVYLFGGRRSDSVLLDEIVRFDPPTGAVQTMSAKLPSGRYNMGAVWTGQYVYLFGGYDYSKVAQIVRYDPATDQLDIMPPSLPTGREWPDAFWDGTYAWLMGGATANSYLRDVVRYDPATQQVWTVPALLPYAPWIPAPFHIGRYAYLYGGTDGPGAPFMSVIRVDPQNGSIALSTFPIASAHRGRSTVSTNEHGYIFGGYNPATGSYRDTVIRFTP